MNILSLFTHFDTNLYYFFSSAIAFKSHLYTIFQHRFQQMSFDIAKNQCHLISHAYVNKFVSYGSWEHISELYILNEWNESENIMNVLLFGVFF